MDIRTIFNKIDEIPYEELDFTEIIGDRAYPSYLGNWSRVYMELLRIKHDTNYPEGRNRMRETYVKRTFQKVMKRTNDMGIAMAVSEDIEIMFDGLTLKYEDPWFLWVVDSYMNCQIPVGTLEIDW